jgi:7-cyano-7-deazaguanine synthase
MTKKAVILLSGGMDSSVLLWHLMREKLIAPESIHAMSINYGQRHARELLSSNRICDLAGIPLRNRHAITIAGWNPPGSSLTDRSVPTPHGHYEAETMRATVVPARNMVMLSLAWGLAVAIQADLVSTAVHAGDHYIYPDCRPKFIEETSRALQLATDGIGSGSPSIYAPFLLESKRDIGCRGASIGAPMELTWSCYEGGDTHCGKCGACNERKEALAGFDNTEYLA